MTVPPTPNEMPSGPKATPVQVTGLRTRLMIIPPTESRRGTGSGDARVTLAADEAWSPGWFRTICGASPVSPPYRLGGKRPAPYKLDVIAPCGDGLEAVLCL